MINPAAISAGIAAATEVYKQGKSLYNAVRPKQRKRQQQSAPQQVPKSVAKLPRGITRRQAPVAFSVGGNSNYGNNVGKRTITRNEFVGTYTSTGAAYNYTRFHVQPGDSTSFPWLSTAADAYALYRFSKLRYRTVPNAATSQPGRCILGIEYEGTGLLSDLASINNASGSQSSSIWADVAVDANIDAMFPFGKYKKISSGSVLDAENSDAAHFYVAFDGVATGVSVSLYVEYTVELFMPKVGVSNGLVNSHTIIPMNATACTGTTYISPNISSSAPEINPFGVVVNTVDKNMILPKGTWEIEISFSWRVLQAATAGQLQWTAILGEWNGSANVEFSGSQDYRLRWLSRNDAYTGNATAHDEYYCHFDKLIYISDGVTPMAVMVKWSASSASYSLASESFMLLSPIL